MEGDGEHGAGLGAWEGPFTFKSRFEEGQGTNPEELSAPRWPAASRCRSHTRWPRPGTRRTGSDPGQGPIRNVNGNPTISQIDLVTRARVPGLDDAAFQEAAKTAKDGCIISRALAGVGDITVDATLES